MAFEVAELTARLRAEVAGFRANLAAADAAIAQARQQLRELELASGMATAAMGDIRIGGAQVLETKSALETMERSISPVTRAALEASDQLAEVKLTAAAAAETVANAEIEKQALRSLRDEAARTRAAGGGGGRRDSFLAGILPGGARPGPAAFAALAGLGAATAPALVPAAVGLGAGLTSGMEALVGAAGTLKLAFADLSAQAFTNQKAFDALMPVQQHFVQTLRSLDAGLVKSLEGVAQQNLLPGLTRALRSAVTPASVGAATGTVQAFSGALSGGAQAFGQLLGSPEFASAFGQVMQADARYLQDFIVGLSKLFDALIHLQQAAIPFTNWLDHGLAGLADWADRSARAAAASGSFARFLDQAKSGLQALGGLLTSVGHLLAALNDVTGIGVAVGVIGDLSAAVQTLANFLEQNQAVLRQFFEGAVQAAHDLITAIGGVLSALHPLIVALNAVATEVGGWRIVFDGFLVYFTARFAQQMLTRLAMIGAAEVGVGTAAATAAGEVGVLRGALLTLGGADILKVLAGLAGGLGGAAAGVAALVASLAGAQGPGYKAPSADQFPLIHALDTSSTDFKGHAAIMAQYNAYRAGTLSPSAFEAFLRAHFAELQTFVRPASGMFGSRPLTQADLERSQTFAMTRTGVGPASGVMPGRDTGTGGVFPGTLGAVQNAAYAQVFGTAGFGTPGALGGTKSDILPQNLLTAIAAADYSGNVSQEVAARQAAVAWINANRSRFSGADLATILGEGATLKQQIATLTGGGTTTRGTGFLTQSQQTALTNAQQAVAATGFTGTSTTAVATAGAAQTQARIQALRTLVNVEAAIYDSLVKQTATGKELRSLEAERVAMSKELARNLGQLSSLTTAQQTVRAQQRITAEQQRLLGIAPQTPGIQSIQRREREILLNELRSVSPGRTLPGGAASASLQGLVQMIQNAGVTLPSSTLRSLNLIHRVLQLTLNEHLKGLKLDPSIVQNLDTRLSEINQTLKNAAKGLGTDFHVPTEKELTAGLNLTPAQRRAVGARLAAVAELHGKVPGSPSAFGIATSHGQTSLHHPPLPAHVTGTPTIVHVHGNIVIEGSFDDPRQAARAIKDELAREARRNATQTRGPNAGRNRGLT